MLREAPEPETTAERRLKNIKGDTPLAQVLKTYYTPQGGKLSLVRVWRGKLTDGIALNGIRTGGIYRLMGQQQHFVNEADAGENDWQGWDNVSAYLPQAEMQNFIVELRSLTLGVGSLFSLDYVAIAK